MKKPINVNEILTGDLVRVEYKDSKTAIEYEATNHREMCSQLSDEASYFLLDRPKFEPKHGMVIGSPSCDQVRAVCFYERELRRFRWVSTIQEQALSNNWAEMRLRRSGWVIIDAGPE